jgi:hypothetical protein
MSSSKDSALKQAILKPCGIYVDLDVLYDTRIGTVARLMGNDVAASVLSAGYHSRMNDNFEGVDVVAYQRLYAARDIETLQRSWMTNSVFLLKEIIGELTKQAITRPYHSGTRLVINTHPYSLTSAEIEALKESIQTWIGDFSELGLSYTTETICISKKDLTPSYCLENFSAMMMYEYEDWFGLQVKAFMACPTPGITLYAPAIYTVETPSPEELQQSIKNATHPLLAIEAYAAGFIKLDLIGVETFSIVTDQK